MKGAESVPVKRTAPTLSVSRLWKQRRGCILCFGKISTKLLSGPAAADAVSQPNSGRLKKVTSTHSCIQRLVAEKFRIKAWAQACLYGLPCKTPVPWQWPWRVAGMPHGILLIRAGNAGRSGLGEHFTQGEERASFLRPIVWLQAVVVFRGGEGIGVKRPDYTSSRSQRCVSFRACAAISLSFSLSGPRLHRLAAARG